MKHNFSQLRLSQLLFTVTNVTASVKFLKIKQNQTLIILALIPFRCNKLAESIVACAKAHSKSLH